MGSRLRTLAVMLYPYLICVCAFLFLCARPEAAEGTTGGGFALLIALIVLVTFLAFISALLNLLAAVRGRRTAEELAKTNRAIKLVHIPAYMLHFALGILGLAMSVWGIGLILWAIFIDLLTIFFSGMLGVSASLRGRSEGLLTCGESIGYAIFSFVYCADVVAAIVLLRRLKGRKK